MPTTAPSARDDHRRGTRGHGHTARRDAARHTPAGGTVPTYRPDLATGIIYYGGPLRVAAAEREVEAGRAAWVTVVADRLSRAMAGAPGAALLRWGGVHRPPTTAQVIGRAPREGGTTTLDVGGWAHCPAITAGPPPAQGTPGTGGGGIPYYLPGPALALVAVAAMVAWVLVPH